jgi:hypothetical protein
MYMNSIRAVTTHTCNIAAAELCCKCCCLSARGAHKLYKRSVYFDGRSICNAAVCHILEPCVRGGTVGLGQLQETYHHHSAILNITGHNVMHMHPSYH